jgi:hypothetical protein
MAGASVGNNNVDKTARGHVTKVVSPKIPTIDIKREIHTLACASSCRPEATADATNGAVIFGTKAIKKKVVKEA